MYFSKTKTGKLNIHFRLLDSELSSYLTLHPPIAKRALYCMCALHPDKKDEMLQKMIDVKFRISVVFFSF
jgi:hypothetical protein